MPTPSDSTPDFNWIRRELGDSAVLPAGTDEPELQPEGEETNPTQETEQPATDTIHGDSFTKQNSGNSGGSESESQIQDIDVSDANILEDDSPISDEQTTDSTDVILREQSVAEDCNQDDFAANADDFSEQAQPDAATDLPAFGEKPTAVANISHEVESASVSQADKAEVASPAAGPIVAEAPVEVDSVKAFDLETPTPAADFPTPSVPVDPSHARDLRAASSRGVTGKIQPSATDGKPIGRILLISYASAVTIFCVFLLMQLMREFRPHQLESLPDVPPLNEGQSQFYPADAVLPDGHVLQLGGARRFGDILVEPLRVTYGPLQYEHWTGEASRVRPASEESVAKLWLRLTNESLETSIAPLDARLVLNSRYRSGEMLTNSFLRPASSTTKLELMHSLPAASEWELQGQDMGLVLGPGESFETYVATDFEHLSDVVGIVGSDNRDLVWRLHLRKGYGPAGQGVTTLVEVTFNGSEIQQEG